MAAGTDGGKEKKSERKRLPSEQPRPVRGGKNGGRLGVFLAFAATSGRR